MSRVIKIESAGKDRIKLSKSIVAALRELMKLNEANGKARDLAAYTALALAEIFQTVDLSVAAWEKRGYWVKADRFRLEWEWTLATSNAMKVAVLSEDWTKVAMLSAQIGQKLASIKVADRNRLGTPWEGAYIRLKQG